MSRDTFWPLGLGELVRKIATKISLICRKRQQDLVAQERSSNSCQKHRIYNDQDIPTVFPLAISRHDLTAVPPLKEFSRNLRASPRRQRAKHRNAQPLPHDPPWREYRWTRLWRKP
jgi:hypothetical protein